MITNSAISKQLTVNHDTHSFDCFKIMKVHQSDSVKRQAVRMWRAGKNVSWMSETLNQRRAQFFGSGPKFSFYPSTRAGCLQNIHTTEEKLINALSFIYDNISTMVSVWELFSAKLK